MVARRGFAALSVVPPRGMCTHAVAGVAVRTRTFVQLDRLEGRAGDTAECALTGCEGKLEGRRVRLVWNVVNPQPTGIARCSTMLEMVRTQNLPQGRVSVCEFETGDAHGGGSVTVGLGCRVSERKAKPKKRYKSKVFRENSELMGEYRLLKRKEIREGQISSGSALAKRSVRRLRHEQ